MIFKSIFIIYAIININFISNEFLMKIKRLFDYQRSFTHSEKYLVERSEEIV